MTQRIRNPRPLARRQRASRLGLDQREVQAQPARNTEGRAMKWTDVPPWVARHNDRRAAMERIAAVAAAFLGDGMKWTKAVDAILTEIDGLAKRGGRVGGAHIPEIQS